MEEFFNKMGLLILLIVGIAIGLYAVVYLTVIRYIESKKLSNFLGGIVYLAALYFGIIYISYCQLFILLHNGFRKLLFVRHS